MNHFQIDVLLFLMVLNDRVAYCMKNLFKVLKFKFILG